MARIYNEVPHPMVRLSEPERRVVILGDRVVWADADGVYTAEVPESVSWRTVVDAGGRVQMTSDELDGVDREDVIWKFLAEVHRG